MVATDNSKKGSSRKPVTPHNQRLLLMAGMIRSEKIFAAAENLIEPEDFPQSESYYQLLWSVALDYRRRFGTAPEQEHMAAELELRLTESPDFLTEQEEKRMWGYLNVIYSLKPEVYDADIILHYLREFGKDLIARQAAKEFDSETIDSHVPSTPTELLEELSMRASRFESAGMRGIEPAFEDDWSLDALEDIREPCGVDFMDQFMGGGVSRDGHEAIGLMAPFGSCKTTIAIQMAVALSIHHHRLYKEALQRGEEDAALGIVYQFFWEGSKKEMQNRALAALAQVPRNNIADPSTLSDPTNPDGPIPLKEYEHQRFAATQRNGGVIIGERRRLKSARDRLQVNWKPVTMMADSLHDGRGGGLTREIATMISEDQANFRAAGQKVFVAAVIVDYVGAAVQRHCDVHSKNFKEVGQQLIKKFAFDMKNHVCKPLHTWCLLLHQFNAEANALPPTKLPTGEFGGDCRVFKENLDFLFVAGNPTEDEHRIARFGCDKHRSAEAVQPILIQIDGAFSRVRETDAWVLDTVTRSFVQRSDMHSVSSVAPSTAARLSQPAGLRTTRTQARQNAARSIPQSVESQPRRTRNRRRNDN